MTHNSFRRFALAALATAMAGTAACTDAETPTSATETPATITHAPAQESQGGIIHEMPVLPAFDVDLRASGAMQPGKPFQVHLSVKANLPVADAEVIVGAPDIDRPLVATLDDRFGNAVARKPAKRHERRGGWGQGQSYQQTVQLTPRAPGYYRIIASAFSRSELPRTVGDSLRVVGDVHAEIWVRVDKRGGRYTAQFDTTVFPAQAERRAGPLLCTIDLDEERRGKQRDPGCDGAVITEFDSESITTRSPATGLAAGAGTAGVAAAGSAAAMVLPGDEIICPMSASTCDPCTFDPLSCYTPPPPPPPPAVPTDPCYARTHMCVKFVYLDRNGVGPFDAPEGTLVEASYQDRDCAIACWWEEERSTFYRTDDLGRVIIPCPSSSTEKRLRTAYEFLDEHVAVSRSEWDGPTVHGTCPTGWKTVEMIPNQEAFVYGNMRKSGQRARQLFWWTSERTRVDFDNGSLSLSASHYNAPLNRISILGVDIWGNSGASTQAHEYGHSYHHKALGGIGHIYISGDPNHRFTDNSNGAKALLEGFATFFETLVMPGKDSYIHYYVRDPATHSPALPTGPRAESRVAAFLWDYVDDGQEKGSSGEYGTWGTLWSPLEPWDLVQSSHMDLAHVLIWCREGTFQTRPESIEALLPCFYERTTVAGQTNLQRLYARTVNGII